MFGVYLQYCVQKIGVVWGVYLGGVEDQMVVVGGMDGVFVVVFGGVVYVEWCGGCVFLIWYV